MGGAFVGKFAATYPERVLSIGFFAPSGTPSSEKSEYITQI